ncbi:MAG: DUF433 domain-containing protein [Deltaproteobacteria bacterium]|nr:DUF433 domain-containing protein [Deltaproteobacteria bacterium]MBI3388087.1 DUF433 domain-containing protein [Deltaproteobacteria bacterium]
MPDGLRTATQDLREMPSYRITEAAHYLGMPLATLRAWTLGQPYATRTGPRLFAPLIGIAQRKPPLLSFLNLVEIHVLDAIRREHKLSLQKVRKALRYLREQCPSAHPLADQKFMTDGLDLFTTRYGQLINISRAGQLAMRELLEAHLRRIERDPAGIPIKLYPFTRRHDADEPKRIVIDPTVSFGRPVLAGTGIATAVVTERYKAGESVDDLAEDYGRDRLDIEEAIRCELEVQAA